MKRVDHHSHILSAGIVEMVAAARKKGIAEYSITEHVSQFKELRDTVGFGDIHSTGRIFSSLKEYREEFKKLGTIEGQLKVNRGIEVDFAPRYEKRVGDFVNQENWDILLCSVHEFEDGKATEHIGGTIDDRPAAYARWYDYFRLLQAALESNFVPFEVLTHPVRVARKMKYVPPEIDDLMLDLATKARRTGRKLELNGRDVKYAPELVKRLAKACSKAGSRVSLGSDAHHPDEVFQNLDFTLKLIEEFKLQT